ncbi:MAG: hypothetical protein IH840_08960 [Candidatus Heimdallarchaeota archaeon]|nr:hypothetical protein [Candidatus Heimdallarchaeota archaeon]
MSDDDPEIGDIGLEPFNDENARKKKISDYVTVLIDSDDDVHIIDNFLGKTEAVLPKDEALGVAKYILEILGED